MVDCDPFALLTRGSPLPELADSLVFNCSGESLLHVAAKLGRDYSVAKLLQSNPELAAVSDCELQLPEHVALTAFSRQQCSLVRQFFLVEYTLL
tara:strand:+ start:696 stop:977 length:282 start_codon:yes stop_codon:yes gene_type:complete